LRIQTENTKLSIMNGKFNTKTIASIYFSCSPARVPGFISENATQGSIPSPLSLLFLSGVRLSPLGTVATTALLYQPQMIDGDCGAIGGMKIGRGN
jgi:hypothetical protein